MDIQIEPKDYTRTFEQLLSEAYRRYLVREDLARQTLREAGFTTYRPDMYLAAISAIDYVFVPRNVEEEPFPWQEIVII